MYEEKQQFSANRLILIPYVLLAAALVFALYLLSAKTAGAWFEAFLPFAILLLVTILLRITKLQVRIYGEAICYCVYPFQIKWRIINKTEISEIAVVAYDPVRDYGGWGIRFSGKGRAFTTKGNFGIHIRLNSGKNILIGTQRPKEVFSFLAEKGYSPQNRFA